MKLVLRTLFVLWASVGILAIFNEWWPINWWLRIILITAWAIDVIGLYLFLLVLVGFMIECSPSYVMDSLVRSRGEKPFISDQERKKMDRLVPAWLFRFLC